MIKGDQQYVILNRLFNFCEWLSIIIMKQSKILSTLLLIILLVQTNSALTRKNRTKLAYTYVDYLNQNYCSSRDPFQFDQSELVLFNQNIEQNSLIDVDIAQIVGGKSWSQFITFKILFFAKIAMYCACLTVFWVVLRKINHFNNLISKVNIYENSDHKSQANLVLKVLKSILFILLIIATYNALKGLANATEVQNALSKVTCGIINFPDDFNRKDMKHDLDYYHTFNDYQFETLNLRQSFKNIYTLSTEMQKNLTDQHFANETSKLFQNNTKSGQVANGLISMISVLEEVKKQSKLCEASLNYIREILYWMKGALIFGISSVDSVYSIDKMPGLAGKITLQIYTLVWVSSLGSLFALAYILSNSKRLKMLRLITFVLGFNAFLLLSLSFLGEILMILPKSACSLAHRESDKSKLMADITQNIKFSQKQVMMTIIQLMKKISPKEDGNMAFVNKKVYQDFALYRQQLLTIKAFDLANILSEIQVDKNSANGVQQYLLNYGAFLSNLDEINAYIETINLAVDKKGQYGRLTLQPIDQYFTSNINALCSENLNAWNKNNIWLLVCGLNIVACLIVIQYYLKSQLKNEYVNPSEEDEGYEMGPVTEPSLNNIN